MKINLEKETQVQQSYNAPEIFTHFTQIHEYVTENRPYEFNFNMNYLTFLFLNISNMKVEAYYNIGTNTYYAGEISQESQNYGLHSGATSFFLVATSKINQTLDAYVVDDSNLTSVSISTIPYQNLTIPADSAFLYIPTLNNSDQIIQNATQFPQFIIAKNSINFSSNYQETTGVNLNYTVSDEPFFIGFDGIKKIQKQLVSITYNLSSTVKKDDQSSSDNENVPDTSSSVNNKQSSEESSIGLILMVSFLVIAIITFIYSYVRQKFLQNQFTYVELE